MKNVILAVAVAVVSVGCGAGVEGGIDELKGTSGGGGGKKTTTSTTTTTETSTYAMRTTDARTSGVEPTWKTSMPIYSTYDVYFGADLPASTTGRHTAMFAVKIPGGSVYEQIQVTFATDVTAAPGEQQAEKTSTGWRIWGVMAVAGTMIQSSNIVGTWSADLYLDGAATPATASSFELY